MSAADESLGAIESAAAEPPTSGSAASGSGTHSADGKRITPIPTEDVVELVSAFDKAVRARRLYEENNPVYHGFRNTLVTAFGRIWEHAQSVTLNVEEGAFRWYGQLLHAGEGRDNLPFQFYKDGVRQITFLAGFEEELERFLSVVQRARLADQQSDDDMVTLLWEEEFTCFQYGYVDALAEGVDLSGLGPPVVSSADGELDRIDISQLQTELANGDPPDDQSPAVRAGQPSVASSITRDDFNETLYFLEPSELEQLQREVGLEWARDTKRGVLDALFDRLEDPVPEWQDEILRILRQLLPAFLSHGDLHSASYIVLELGNVVKTAQLTDDARREAERIFVELSEPAVLSQLLRSLAEGAIQPDPDELGVFLSHLGPSSLPLLMHALETISSQSVQARLQQAVESLARDFQGEVVRLLGSDEIAVACGAARVAGRLQLADAVPGLCALMDRSDPAVRRTAVSALVGIRNAPALEAIQDAIDDDDRDVRMAAVRGLGTLRYQPARARIEQALQGRIVRDADLSEKMAFFEAFGAVATPDSIDMLDRLLNGRKLFSRSSPELRACAAMALGRISAPAARTALERAAGDQQPIVRNAVAKALRREEGGAA